MFENCDLDGVVIDHFEFCYKTKMDKNGNTKSVVIEKYEEFINRNKIQKENNLNCFLQIFY